MYQTPSLNVDSEDSVLDISTAPTTPDGSLTFSPVLQALKLQDALEDASSKEGERKGSASLDATLYSSPSGIKNVCCVGAGYVGGPTAAVMAYQNPHLNITVVDRDPCRISAWNSKHLPIYEPGLSSVLRMARDGSKAFSFPNSPSSPQSLDSISRSSAISECESQCGKDEIHIPARAPNLFFSTEVARCISEADIILIAVNTPTKTRGLGAGRATDLTALEAVTREIAINAKPGAILVEKSTVPCRTAEIIQDTLKQHRPNLTFPILSNPEFLAAGTAINDLLFPDRVLIGSSPSSPEAAKALAGLYSWVPREKIVETNIFSSELAKLVANSMLAQRISSINSISAICERTGADIEEISKAVGMDPRIGGKYLKAGIGFGGSCFRKDVLSLCYLAESLNLPEVAEYWEGVLRINEWQRERFVKRVVRCLNGTLVGKKISVLGYAFKRDTSDTRESPALECIKQLLEDGPGEIAVFDPFCETGFVREEIGRILGGESLKVNGGCVEVYADVYRACEGSIAVCVLTDCEEFRSTLQAPSTSSSPPASKQFKDPRPFLSHEPTETDILALQKHLISVNNTPDPLNRFEEEPQCAEGCVSCDLERKKIEARDKKGEKLDWSRIAYHLATPKWVFDGRNVLDKEEMEKLGVRLESIGRVGWGGLGA